MGETGRNPNVTKRNKVAAEIKLGEAFSVYRELLENKQPPAKHNTFKVFDKSVRKFDSWKITRVRDLTSAMIIGD